MEDTNKEVSFQEQVARATRPLDLSGFKLIVDRNTEEAKQRLNNQEYEEEPRKVR